MIPIVNIKDRGPTEVSIPQVIQQTYFSCFLYFFDFLVLDMERWFFSSLIYVFHVNAVDHMKSDLLNM